MSLDVGDALRDGASRTVERNALALMVGFAALAFASLVVRQSFAAWYFEWIQSVGPTPSWFEQPATPLALAVPPAATVALWLAIALVAEAYRIVAVRTLVSDHVDRIPREFLTRNIGWATVNGFVAGVVVGTLVLLGGLLLIVPGVFLLLSFLFVRQEIAVEDANFADAMVGSWELTEGNRVELAVLGLVWLTFGFVIFVVDVGIGGALPADSLVSPLASALLSAPFAVFVVATAARAYVQLTGEDGESAGDAGSDDGGESDDEEWPDPPGVDI